MEIKMHSDKDQIMLGFKSIGDAISRDAKRRIFIKFIDLYGVQASYGAGMVMTIDHEFRDSLGVFGPVDRYLYQHDIAGIWKQLVRGQWDFDYSNPFVDWLAKAEYSKEHPDEK